MQVHKSRKDMKCPNCNTELKHCGDMTRTPKEYTWRCDNCGYREPSSAKEFVDRQLERIREAKKKVQ